MSTFSIFLVLITIICFLLVVVIMVQNPKGGGLSSSLGGSTQIGGVQKTTDFLDKSTWVLATSLIVLVLLSSLSFTGALSDTGSKVIEDAPATSAPAPTTPKTDAATTAQPAATTTTETAPPPPPTTEKK